VVPVRVGEVDLLVETVLVAGTEPTSGLDKVGDRIVDAFAAAREAIVEVASSTAEVVGQLGQRARRPDQLEVEFGLSFTAKGNVIVVGGEAGEGCGAHPARTAIGEGSAGPRHRGVRRPTLRATATPRRAGQSGHRRCGAARDRRGRQDYLGRRAVPPNPRP
jgi:hypothetical protein